MEQLTCSGVFEVCRNSPKMTTLRCCSHRNGGGGCVSFSFFGRGDRRNSFLYIFVVISQGSLNYLFWGESNLMQMYGNIEAFPLKTSALFGLVSQNDPCQNPPKVFHKSPLKNGFLPRDTLNNPKPPIQTYMQNTHLHSLVV